ncbi:MAG: CRISPR-associated endonuclease Cas2 [Verrucomicrobia bacterium]|nr:CRISPR-associated endonuclease Cas2 [Verrucomicrobiota bacterium]
MRTTYIVSYDVREPKRLRKVFETCKKFGAHLQLSVFECDLTDADRIKFERALHEIINHEHDQVLFIELGPTASRGQRTITSLGVAYSRIDSACYVV